MPPSLSRTADTEAAASEGNRNVSSADSESSFDKPDVHEVGSFVASNDVGGGSASPIDWPATPARPQNKIELPLIPDNAHHIGCGVTDEHHPISTKEYSPIDISDKDYPPLPSPTKMPKTFKKPFILRSAQKKRVAPADGSDSDHSETCSPSKRSAQKKRAAPLDGSDSNHSETRSPSKRPRKFILPPAAARDLLQPVDDEAPLPTAEEYPASVVIHGRVYYAFGSLPLQPGAGAPLTRSALPRSFAVGGNGNLESLPGGPKAGNHSEPASDHESSDSFHSRELEYPANSSSPLHHRSPIDTGSSVLTRDPPVLSSPSPPLPSNPLDGWTPSRHSTSLAKDSSLSSRKGSRSSSSVALKMHSHAAFPLQPDTTASSPSPPQSLLSSPAHLKAGLSPANTSPMGSSSLCPSSSVQEKKRLRAPKLPVALSGRPLHDQLISQALSHSPTVVGSSAVSGPTINIGNLEFVPATGTVLRRTGCLNVDWIDAHLRASYRSVTNLASILIWPSSDETPTDDEDYLLYDKMVSALSASLELSIRGVVNFTHFGNFFDPARFNPAAIPPAITHARSSNKKHLVLENDRFFNAVFLAVGRQEESYICKPKTFLLHNKPPRHIRGVRIHSLQQESQTMFAFFGSLFGCSSFGCTVSEEIVDFRSCQQFESEVSKNNRNDLSPLKPVSPTKRNPSKISDRLKNHFFKDPLPFSNAGKPFSIFVICMQSTPYASRPGPERPDFGIITL
ncbi:uncharacterized protein C8R40DRAFT_1065377 [Lentinula edodes]|uniref:uncharacterized protein n=1 Tax=Lentinula edodes TaxID=5353 RepID=UPI001E8CDED0|nr:uncharacterized protein C8R40DRAFT_1065377 [Lentinula edodes]KAH7880298.1 hypothetical protein C8R40DRAFT_1065377 [Lentinula edodes]